MRPWLFVTTGLLENGDRWALEVAANTDPTVVRLTARPLSLL
jgi:hypothetical protein